MSQYVDGEKREDFEQLGEKTQCASSEVCPACSRDDWGKTSSSASKSHSQKGGEGQEMKPYRGGWHSRSYLVLYCPQGANRP